MSTSTKTQGRIAPLQALLRISDIRKSFCKCNFNLCSKLSIIHLFHRAGALTLVYTSRDYTTRLKDEIIIKKDFSRALLHRQPALMKHGNSPVPRGARAAPPPGAPPRHSGQRQSAPPVSSLYSQLLAPLVLLAALLSAYRARLMSSFPAAECANRRGWRGLTNKRYCCSRTRQRWPAHTAVLERCATNIHLQVYSRQKKIMFAFKKFVCVFFLSSGIECLLFLKKIIYICIPHN